MSSPFAVTVPATTVHLAENRMGKMPFTITNMADQPVHGTVSVVPLDSTPLEWFSPIKAEVNLPPHGSAQVLIKVEPRLGAAAATHLFRVDVDDPTTPEANVTGPSCSVVVPPLDPRTRWSKPRGYLATLLGASVGGALGELYIFLLFVWGPKQQECGGDYQCELNNLFGEIVFLLAGILLGLGLLWVGAVAGAFTALRIREYLGSKLTALFLAILMVPWTIGMLWLLGKITDSVNGGGLALVIILAPILLTAVPGLIARGSVLLMRTKHL